MRYYFMGIAGTAMASVAVLLKKKGHEVWGTDTGIYPPMSDFLEENQIPVKQGFSVENLKQEFDFAVIGNAMTRGNEEVEYILNKLQNCPFCVNFKVKVSPSLNGYHVTMYCRKQCDLCRFVFDDPVRFARDCEREIETRNVLWDRKVYVKAGTSLILCSG